MKRITRTNRFKKDVKRMKKRGKNFETFKGIIRELAQGNTLPRTFREHALSGNYSNTLECHVEPDWLLIYQSTNEELILIRTGSHSDLFK